MKILIVDDEEYLRAELRDSLERVIPSNEYLEAEDYDSAIKLLKENRFDIAFLDIQLKGQSGLNIAEAAKRICPKTNIVMVTAYSEYAVDAFKLFVSGYILKPFSDDDLKEVLANLRNPVNSPGADRRLEVQCFGNFEVFADGRPMKFKRQREKEILAYLIVLKGASANKNEICANIFDDSVTPDKADINFRQGISSLKKDLTRYGFENLLIHDSKNAYSVDVSLIHCDFYDCITGKMNRENVNSFDFMNQYSWAEEYRYMFED